MPDKDRRPHLRTLLVTVGSTLFPALTNTILSPPILSLLSNQGIGRLIVQYGRADIPSTLHVQLDAKGCGEVMVGELAVQVVRYTDDFEGLIRRSDAVISHAGSGSILAVLRRSPTPAPPLLVVPNESLMDNHQAELADELGKAGYLMVSRVQELETTLPLFLGGRRERDVKPFPMIDSERFRGVLDETMGFI